MTYTREQLEKMSDDEINVDLHCKLLGEPWEIFAEVSDSLKQLCLHDAAGNPYFEDVPNYCNSWNDIMPLAVEYKISLVNVLGNNMWKSRDVEADIEVWSGSPQRAIACCLLMMEIGK